MASGGNQPGQEPGENGTVIVVAGRPHNGKSQALNNIFGVNFESKVSAYSVTRKIKYLRVKKDGKELILVDTPGLGAVDVPIDTVRREFEAIVGGLNYTLLFCHSVGPNSMLTDMDRIVPRNLQKMCGTNVWNKCVILFTFSDTLREQGFPDINQRDDYIQVLRDHAGELTKMLRKECGKQVPDIKIVLDINNVQEETIAEIIAVPMGLKYKDKKEKHNLLFDEGNQKDWRNRAYLEILRKAKPLDRVTLLTVTHGAATVSGAYLGIGIGILIGGFTGTCVGILAGGFGAIPGAAIGAVAGGIAAGMGGAGAGHAVVSHATNVKAKKVKKLSEGDRHIAPEQREPEQQEAVHREQGQAEQEALIPPPQLRPQSSPRSTPKLRADRSSDAGSAADQQAWASHTYPEGPRLLQRTPDPVQSQNKD